jgi:predicted lipoprotein with Yx(FWY)xxD motif
MKFLVFLTVAAVALLGGPTAHSEEIAPAEIVLQKTDAGWTLTDRRGMSIYVYDDDKSRPGKSACDARIGASAKEDDGCSKVFPAVKAGPKAKPFGEWSIIERLDGARQWTFQGQPLYTYVNEPYAGATFGEDDFWHTAFRPRETPPEIKISKTGLGRVLTDLTGMTLYTRDDEGMAQQAICGDDCLVDWKPALAPWVAQPFGSWSVFVRKDGARQWAFKGKPLYTHEGDVAPGTAYGDGAENRWRAAVLESRPPLPSWVTVQKSDMGRVIADAQGRTLYGFVGDLKKVNRISCSEDCVRQNWRPVLATAETKPVGNFSVKTVADGSMQWAYKEVLLYTHVLDEKPGNIRGDRFASGNGNRPYAGGWWRPLLEGCMCIPTSQSLVQKRSFR